MSMRARVCAKKKEKPQPLGMAGVLRDKPLGEVDSSGPSRLQQPSSIALAVLPLAFDPKTVLYLAICKT